MLPKLKLVTFSCLKNSKNRVGILLENRTVIDLTSVSPKPAYHDMLKFIDGGKDTMAETKSIARNPPAAAILAEKSVVLKAPIPLPRLKAAKLTVNAPHTRLYANTRDLFVRRNA